MVVGKIVVGTTLYQAYFPTETIGCGQVTSPVPSPSTPMEVRHIPLVNIQAGTPVR